MQVFMAGRNGNCTLYGSGILTRETYIFKITLLFHTTIAFYYVLIIKCSRFRSWNAPQVHYVCFICPFVYITGHYSYCVSAGCCVTSAWV